MANQNVAPVAPVKQSIGISLSNPVVIFGIILVILCSISMMIYVFSETDETDETGTVTTTPVILDNCSGEGEIFIPYNKWEEDILSTINKSGERTATSENLFNGYSNYMLVQGGAWMDECNIGDGECALDIKESRKHGKEALGRYMVNIIKDTDIIDTNVDIDNDVKPFITAMDKYYEINDPSNIINYKDSATTVTKIEIDKCENAPKYEDMYDDTMLFGDIYLSFTPVSVMNTMISSIECQQKMNDYDGTTTMSRFEYCEDGINPLEGITTITDTITTCSYDELYDDCDTTMTPNPLILGYGITKNEVQESLDDFDYCKAFYSKEGYNCVINRDNEGKVKCKNDTRCKV